MIRNKTDKRCWYALYVNVRHEKSIADQMNGQGIECYVPLIKQMRQWSDRKKLIEVPLIPGYVFMNLLAEEMDKPRYVPGVVNYVRFQGKPAVIRAEEIDGLKYFTENGYVLEEIPGEELNVGDRVEFGFSDFKSYVAVVEELVGDRYAIVTFEGVKKNFRLKAALKALRKKSVSSKE